MKREKLEKGRKRQVVGEAEMLGYKSDLNQVVNSRRQVELEETEMVDCTRLVKLQHMKSERENERKSAGRGNILRENSGSKIITITQLLWEGGTIYCYKENMFH